MNLLARIEDRLDNPRYRLQPSDFEDCAAALIGRDYPGLVPVTGGTDHGLDAELVDPNGQVLGLIVTSSRTFEGARRSLRDSLRSARDHGKRVDQVVVANLAEVNLQKRLKLTTIAKELGCDLVQVYDRPWFANAFREDPEWRRRILHIEGGTFCLSRTPRGVRPEQHQLSTIGRDELLECADNSVQDLILWGVPGVGKSHVAGRLGGALFLAQGATPDRLLDDLLTTAPDVVVIDDAGGRLEDIQHLLDVRHMENLTFRVAVTCWPHEKDHVADHLPDARQLEVDLLSMEEIGTLLRERGITRLSVIVELLQQAQGRPAWALNLADVLIRQGDWRAVWTGQAVREQIQAFLRRSNAPAEAIQLLAAIALVGGATQDQARIIARLFELTPTQFEELIRSVAIAGLVDVRRNALWRDPDGRAFEHFYRVVPRTIAASIVGAAYFHGTATALRISDIKRELPELHPGILQTQVDAALLGADEPMVPTEPELVAVLCGIGPGSSASELLRSYALINSTCARFVFVHLAESVKGAAALGDEGAAMAACEDFAACTADSLESSHSPELSLFFASLATLAAHGWDCTKPIKALVDDVLDARTGDPPSSSAIVRLCAGMASDQAKELPDHVWIALACSVLQPTLDGNFMNPEKPNSLVLQSFTWPKEDIDSIYDALEPELVRRVPEATKDDLAHLIEVMSKWVHIAGGHGLPYGGVPDSGQRLAAGRVAASIADAIAPVIATPGLRAVFNSKASRIGVRLDEPDDLFAALIRKHDRATNWEEWGRRRAADLDRALADYFSRSPAVLMTWLRDHEAALGLARHSSAVRSVMGRLAMRSDPEVWLNAAMDHGLGHAAGPLISRCVDDGVLTLPLAAELLADAGGRSQVISSVIVACQNAELKELVLKSLTGDDIKKLDSDVALRNISDAIRNDLFTHPDAMVRSTAAALWAAKFSFCCEDVPQDPNWASAMTDLVIPHGTLIDDWQSTALKAFAGSHPEAYMDLLHTHVKNLSGYDAFDGWLESARELSSTHRLELWYRVRESPMAEELFWVIAAGDTKWIMRAVSDPSFPVQLRTLLHAKRFQFGTKYPLKDLAVMLRPLKWRPDDLLSTLEVGMHVGEEHERLERNLAVCHELAESSEPDLAELGNRGVETLERRLAQAKAAARRAAVRGTFAY